MIVHRKYGSEHIKSCILPSNSSDLLYRSAHQPKLQYSQKRNLNTWIFGWRFQKRIFFKNQGFTKLISTNIS
jgi:hypothetical protein